MNFICGQKAKLADLTSSLSLEVGVLIDRDPNLVIDLSCFGLDAEGKLSDERYFIFYNQKASICGALSAQGERSGFQEVFKIDLELLPTHIRRLVFVATIDGQGRMSEIGQSNLYLLANGQAIANFPFSGADLGDESALMIAEIYFKDTWRFAAVRQGFFGGLSALLTHFGGAEALSPRDGGVSEAPKPANRPDGDAFAGLPGEPLPAWSSSESMPTRSGDRPHSEFSPTVENAPPSLTPEENETAHPPAASPQPQKPRRSILPPLPEEHRQIIIEVPKVGGPPLGNAKQEKKGGKK